MHSILQQQNPPVDSIAALRQQLDQFRQQHPQMTGMEVLTETLRTVMDERAGGKMRVIQLSLISNLVGSMLGLITDTLGRILEDAEGKDDTDGPTSWTEDEDEDPQEGDSDPEFTELLAHVDTAQKEGREIEYHKWKPSEDAIRRGNRVVATECGLLRKWDEEAAAMAAESEARHRKAEEEWNRTNGEKRYSNSGDEDYGELRERDRRNWGWRP